MLSVKIDGCIICNHATILDKASMKDCEVAGGYTVDKDSKSNHVYSSIFNTLFLRSTEGRKVSFF